MFSQSSRGFIILTICVLLYYICLFGSQNDQSLTQRKSKPMLHFILTYNSQNLTSLRPVKLMVSKIKETTKFNVKVYIIGQNDNKPFHRSWLLNIGLQQSLKEGKAQCIITHDIRTPLVNIDYGSCVHPREIYPIDKSDHCMCKSEDYSNTVVASPDDWKKINGYSYLFSYDSENLYERFIHNDLLLVGHRTCGCKDNGDGNVVKETKPKQLTKGDGLDSLHYFIHKTWMDKRSNTWLKVGHYPFISDIDMDKIKREIVSSPIVVPKYKLIFFWNEKCACTFWKSVLHYIQNITTKRISSVIHYPSRSGLSYLRNYADTEVAEMMYSDTWTKAVFVREPRERILSTYLNKIVHEKYDKIFCNTSVTSFMMFLQMIKTCKDNHWTSQVRLPIHFYKSMMVGKLDNIWSFTEELLSKIGAWNSDTKRWLLEQTPIFNRNTAKTRINQYYNRDLEDQVLKMYKEDFKVFDFDMKYYTNH